MGTDKITPPPGFVLDEPLPEGFVVDQPSTAETPIFQQIVSMLKSGQEKSFPRKEWFTGPPPGQVSPEGIKEFASEAMPAIGSTVLSLLSKGRVKIPAAGLGGGMGELAREVTAPSMGIQAPKPFSAEGIRETLKQTGYGAGGEIAGPLIGKFGEKVLSPFAKGMTEKGKALYALAKEKTLAIMPSEMRPSWLASLSEGFSDFFLPGRIIKHSQVKKTFNKLGDEIDTFLAKNATTQAASDVGEMATRGVEKAVKNFWDESSILYNKEFLGNAEELAQTAGPINLNKTKEVVRALWDREKTKIDIAQDDKAMKFFKQFESRFTTDNKIGPEEFHEFYKAINKGNFEKWEAIAKPIKEAMEKDLESWVTPYQSDFIYNVLKKANGHYREGMEDLIDNPIIKKMFTSPTQTHPVPEKIVTLLMSPANKEMWGTLQKKLSAEMVQTVKERFLANFFDPISPMGSKIIKEINPNMNYIDGKILKSFLDSNRKALTENFSKETVQALDNIATLSKAAMPTVESYKKGLSGGFWGVTNTAALAYLASTVSLPLTVLGVAGSMPLAHSLVHPNGVLKNFLTVGLMPQVRTLLKSGVGKEGLKIGTKLAVRPKSEPEE